MLRYFEELLKTFFSDNLRVRPARPAIDVREWRAINLRVERREAVLIRLELRGKRHGHVSAAVERMIEANDGLSLGGCPSDLNRVFNCFGPGICQKRFCVDRLR